MNLGLVSKMLTNSSKEFCLKSQQNWQPNMTYTLHIPDRTLRLLDMDPEIQNAHFRQKNTFAGAPLGRLQRVQLHPSIFRKNPIAPVDYT